MATKLALQLNCVLVLVLMGSMLQSGGVAQAADDETWQEVLTTDGTNVVFGASNTYTIWARDIEILYLFEFYFGLGYTGEVVLTDTAVTLGSNGNASQIYVCNSAGKLELVAVNSSGTPANAIVRVRYNSTDSNYRLQITEASPAVYVQFTYLSLGGLLCTSGVAGSPIRFIESNSSISSSSSSPAGHQLHEPTVVLRQVVDA